MFHFQILLNDACMIPVLDGKFFQQTCISALQIRQQEYCEIDQPAAITTPDWRGSNIQTKYRRYKYIKIFEDAKIYDYC